MYSRSDQARDYLEQAADRGDIDAMGLAVSANSQLGDQARAQRFIQAGRDWRSGENRHTAAARVPIEALIAPPSFLQRLDIESGQRDQLRQSNGSDSLRGRSKKLPGSVALSRRTFRTFPGRASV